MMKRKTRTYAAAGAALLIAATLTAGARAATLGPGDVATNANDNSFDLIGVDLVTGMALSPGVYRATDFNYQITGTNGSVAPMIVVGSAGNYRTIALGDAVSGAAGPFTTTAFGGRDTFTVNAGETVYGAVYWDGSATNMPVGFQNGTGSTFIRYGSAGAPSVGDAIGGGASGTFARAYDFSIDVDAVQAGRFGNNPGPRTDATDGATNVMWTNAYAAPKSGEIGSVDVYIQNSAAQSAGSFRLVQLRPTGVANQYDVVTVSEALAPAGTNGTTVSLYLDTPMQLQTGDLIAHYGNGLAFSISSTAPAAHNNQFIYYPSATAPTAGGTITLGPTNANPDFPIFPQVRDYAYGFQLPGIVETVGNGAGQGNSSPDTVGNLLVVMDNDAFTKKGRVFTWQFFNDTAGAAGNLLTPVLLREVAGDLEVIGIGETRTATADGIQQWAFDLVSGTDLVQIGDLLGFYYGDQTGTASTGSVEYTEFGATPIRIYLEGDGIQLSDVFAGGGATYNLSRFYSINATTQIPTPGAWSAGVALLALGAARRQRGR